MVRGWTNIQMCGLWRKKKECVCARRYVGQWNVARWAMERARTHRNSSSSLTPRRVDLVWGEGAVRVGACRPPLAFIIRHPYSGRVGAAQPSHRSHTACRVGEKCRCATQDHIGSTRVATQGISRCSQGKKHESNPSSGSRTLALRWEL